jgi:hypothetical protein
MNPVRNLYHHDAYTTSPRFTPISYGVPVFTPATTNLPHTQIQQAVGDELTEIFPASTTSAAPPFSDNNQTFEYSGLFDGNPNMHSITFTPPHLNEASTSLLHPTASRHGPITTIHQGTFIGGNLQVRNGESGTFF